jgi:hypothetical protein
MFWGKGVGKGVSPLHQSKFAMSEILNTPFFIEKVAEENSVCPALGTGDARTTIMISVLCFAIQRLLPTPKQGYRRRSATPRRINNYILIDQFDAPFTRQLM